MRSDTSLDIAVIGMAGRFAGAPSTDRFWERLKNGDELITRYDDDELQRRGVPPWFRRDPSFVPMAASLDDVAAFDAAFFGYSPAEAASIDPQQRVFLECAWEAMEAAGYGTRLDDQLVGVYAGVSLSTYLLHNLLADRRVLFSEDSFQTMIGNDKDFLSSRVSYKLHLTGPSLDVQTGCSTSLVAVHLACQALLGFQCDLALAGGVSVQVPQRTGYIFQPGGISSPDGHCRAFDAQAAGTIFGSGAGVVVLRRLEEALEAGDRVLAIIKGSAINNDGADKIGYTAPSISGQSDVIERALAIAGVDADAIGYVETHGTGTRLGDPMEVQALTNVFRRQTARTQFCAIGSVKTNVGHLDAAAGVTGLIKTVLSLQHGVIPPSLHFETPNPEIDFANSPFFVAARAVPWPRAAVARRAGVSSFGIGGTNAHVVVEEAPVQPDGGSSRPVHLLTISGRTRAALDDAMTRLADHLRAHPDVDLADVAHTLHTGRRAFEHRGVLVARDVSDAATALATADPQRIRTAYQPRARRPVFFLCPGGGAQYIDMGRGLYAHEPVFRDHVDQSVELLRDELPCNLRDCLYPTDAGRETAARFMQRTSMALPALFVTQCAMAQLWRSWGIEPQAVIGHSQGEYAAACLAGVLTLDEALRIVTLRGRLFDELPSGAMLSVPLGEDALRPLLDPALDIAAVNEPGECVVSGPADLVDGCAQMLTSRGLEVRKVPIQVAAHSRMVTPVLERFGRAVDAIPGRRPAIPYVSNVTGTWLDPAAPVEPRYWVRHLREPVRFAQGVRTLLAEPDGVFLEIGPGRTLSGFVRAQCDESRRESVCTSIRHTRDAVDDPEFLMQALGRLWLLGVAIDWRQFYGVERRRKVALPTYPFQRQRYWIEPAAHAEAPSGEKTSVVDDWFFAPSWKLTAPQRAAGDVMPDLVLTDDADFGWALVAELQRRGGDPTVVHAGPEFACVAAREYVINPLVPSDYDLLIQAQLAEGGAPKQIVNLWGLSASDGDLHQRAFYSLTYLAQALERHTPTVDVTIRLVTAGLHRIDSHDRVHAGLAPASALCRVIPQELERVRCACIDLSWVPDERASKSNVAAIADECRAPLRDVSIALRGGLRWIHDYARLDVAAEQPPRIRARGTYLITGGLGEIGRQLAEHLARRYQANLVLTTRRLADRSAQRAWIAGLEAAGAGVLLCEADVADVAAMRHAIAESRQRFGPLHGVIHCAGLAGQQAVGLVGDLDRATCDAHFRAKVRGTRVLHETLAEETPDFVVLFSSNASTLGGIGLGAYAAANAYLDAFALAERQRGAPWVSVSWDGWLAQQGSAGASLQTSLDRYAMTADESLRAFERATSLESHGHTIVSTGDLHVRVKHWIGERGRVATRPASFGADSGAVTGAAAADTAGPKATCVPPTTEVEQDVLTIWQELLGLAPIGIHDNFFELGGSSLLGLKMISRIKRACGIDLPIVAIFEAPTVHLLAKRIEHGRNEPAHGRESLERGERRRARRAEALAEARRA